MDIYKSLELTESMNKQAILDKLFVARKKCVTKQNSANPEKRSEAEALLEVINDLESLMEFLPETFSQAQLVVKTYQFDHQHEATPDHSVRNMKDSINGDFEAVCRLTNMLREYAQWELSSKWYYTFITKRNVKAYEPYGQDMLFMAETKEGIKWLEKAYDENCISEVGLYNLGISYFGQTSYTKALRYFEEAYDNGYHQGLHHIAWMYETGNGTNVNYEKALEWYERAQQYEDGYDATEDTRRVRGALAAQMQNGERKVQEPTDDRNAIQKLLQDHKITILSVILGILLVIIILLNRKTIFGGNEKPVEESSEMSSAVDTGVTTRTEYFRAELSDAKISYKKPVPIASLTVDNYMDSIVDHSAAALTDGGLTTCWQDGLEGDAAGTVFTITLEKPTNVHYVMIYNGNRESKEVFDENNRVKDLTVTVKGEERQVTLPDLFAGQVIEMIDCSNVTEIKIRIDSVYEGTTYNDTCISEIVVY